MCTTMTEISSVRVAREIQMLGENMKYFKAGNKTIVLTAENCPSNCSAWTGNPSHLGPHNFEDPITLWDESHDQFRVYMCNNCKTYFLWHWHEEIGWDGAEIQHHYFKIPPKRGPYSNQILPRARTDSCLVW